LNDSMNFTGKFLVVYPTGGLSDTLQVIGAGLALASESKRNLVISDRAGQLHAKFLDAMYEMPSANGDCLESQVKKLFGTAIEPASKRNQIGIGLRGTGANLELASAKIQEMEAEQTVHMWGGIGLGDPLLVFRSFVLTQEVLEGFRDLSSSAGEDYSAIHIRNTDYRTGYQSVFRRLARKNSNSKLFVATDSPLVRDFARRKLGEKAIIPARIGYRNEAPLHKIATISKDVDAREICREAMVDLLVLASARRLYIVPTFGLRGDYRLRYSGFSLIAESLSRDPMLEVFVGYSGKPSFTLQRQASRLFTLEIIVEYLWRQRLRFVRDS